MRIACALWCAALAFVACGRVAPAITRIEPAIGATGDFVTVHGSGFGATRGESCVLFGSVRPTMSSYRQWTDTTIVVRIPDFGESGLLTVTVNGATSNAVLFSTKEDMPVFPQNTPEATTPHINRVIPAVAPVGSVVKIIGENFGEKGQNSAVRFAWAADSAMDNANDSPPSSVNAQPQDIIAWSNNEITTRVPASAARGGLCVFSGGAQSNAVDFTVPPFPGKRLFKDKKTFAVSYSVKVRVASASSPNMLFLYLPVPPNTPEQRLQETLKQSATPFITDYRGARVYQWENLRQNDVASVALSLLVDVCAVETAVSASKLAATRDNAQARWTQPSPLIPVDSATQQRARAIAGGETNPWRAALAIYRACLASEESDGFALAREFTGLCRALGIPTAPVGGVLVTRFRTTVPHLWNMVYLDGAGWIPVDVALGKGEHPSGFVTGTRGDAADYYFGSIDSNRIAFSFGETVLLPITYDGTTSKRGNEYALQNIWEESSGALESYSLEWSDVDITGVY